MAEVVLFHHAQGLTAGCLAFAERLRAAGHVVHIPDLYDGKTFTTLDDGIGYAQQTGFGTILERGKSAAAALPNDLVYAGFSLGVMPAQLLAKTRQGARGAVLVSAAVPPSEYGGDWPQGVPLQIHMMDGDGLVVDEGDLEAARKIAETVEDAKLFLYTGDKHLFVDSSLPDYDESAAKLLQERVIGFLDALG